MASRRKKPAPPAPEPTHIEFETFRKVDAYARSQMEVPHPSCWNGDVRVRRYRVTIELIDEPEGRDTGAGAGQTERRFRHDQVQETAEPAHRAIAVQRLDVGRRAVASAYVPSVIEADIDFHLFIYEASGNPLFGETAQPHWQHLRRVMAALTPIDNGRFMNHDGAAIDW